jgi:NAD(P)-dependent dehydrogenase (short-subunit alcohol dehydrogenase family)
MDGSASEARSLANRTAIVTGGASGIGRAVALAYARDGARVVVSDIDEDRGAETVELIEQATSGAEAVFLRADVSRPDDHEALVAAAVERFGALHVACNNAGIAGELAPVAEMSVDGWRKVIAINLDGVFYAMRAQIPRMLEAGGGTIVNMASILGQVGTANSAGYVAAKHGVVGLTKTAALEYASQGIRVNAVGPGYIDTPLLEDLPDEARDALVDLHPIGRLGRAEEVAELVAWLSGERASFVQGAYFPVDGGYLAR